MIWERPKSGTDWLKVGSAELFAQWIGVVSPQLGTFAELLLLL